MKYIHQYFKLDLPFPLRGSQSEEKLYNCVINYALPVDDGTKITMNKTEEF